MKVLGVAVAGVLFGVAGCGSSSVGIGQSASDNLTAAHKTCSDKHRKALKEEDYGDPGQFMILGDDKKSIQITSPEDVDLSTTVAIVDAECIAKELKAPSGLAPKLVATTAVMGRQSQTWGKYTFSWSYNGAANDGAGQFDGVFEVK